VVGSYVTVSQVVVGRQLCEFLVGGFVVGSYVLSGRGFVVGSYVPLN
jgi:hypothetical protein